MLRVVLFVKRADYDSLAGAGVNEFPLFEIDADMCHPLSGSSAGEEYQVSLTQVVAGDPVTFFELAVSVPGQADVVYAHVELRYQTGTVCAVLAVASCAIGDPRLRQAASPIRATMYETYLFMLLFRSCPFALHFLGLQALRHGLRHIGVLHSPWWRQPRQFLLLQLLFLFQSALPLLSLPPLWH